MVVSKCCRQYWWLQLQRLVFTYLWQYSPRIAEMWLCFVKLQGSCRSLANVLVADLLPCRMADILRQCSSQANQLTADFVKLLHLIQICSCMYCRYSLTRNCIRGGFAWLCGWSTCHAWPKAVDVVTLTFASHLAFYSICLLPLAFK